MPISKTIANTNKTSCQMRHGAILLRKGLTASSLTKQHAKELVSPIHAESKRLQQIKNKEYNGTIHCAVSQPVAVFGEWIFAS